MVELNFRVEGEVQLSRKFIKIADSFSDFREPFARMSSDYYAGEQETFANEGAFEGKPRWADLKGKYKKWRETHGGKILVLTGALRSAATRPDAEGSVFNIENTRLEIGIDLPVNGWNLAALHQFGTRNNMPARKVVYLSQNQKLRWVRIFRDWVDQQLSSPLGLGY